MLSMKVHSIKYKTKLIFFPKRNILENKLIN